MTPGSSSTTISLEPLSGPPKRQTSFTLAVPSRRSIPWLARHVRHWNSFLLALRAAAISCALALLGAIMAYHHALAQDFRYWGVLLWALAFPAFGGLFWDLADILVRYTRCGRMIPPKASIGLELVVLIATIAVAVLFAVTAVERSSWGDTVPYWDVTIPVAVLTGALIVSRAIFFVRACMDRTRELKIGRPRVMYIPATGVTVYLVSRPKRKGTAIDTTIDFAAAASAAAVPAARGSDESASIPRARHDAEEITPIKPMKRKALLSPPPDDYVPDEAELERRRRGDAQPQLILPGDIAPKFSTNIMGSMPGEAFAVEGKMLVWPKREDGTSSRLSEAPRRRSL